MDGSDPATYPGIYGVFPLTLSIPGPDAGVRQVPCAGLTWVGVHPDHRRKGVLSAMLRHHFEQVHEEEGTHVSALHASEPAIYGRHGYGLASQELEVSLGQGYDAHRARPGGRGRRGHHPAGDGRPIPTCRSGCGSATSAPPASARWSATPATTPASARQLPEDLRDKESWRVLFARRDGVDVGFAMFRRTHKWERARPAGELSVWALVGDPAARLALLRRLVDFDLIGTVKVGTVGVDDPLLLWVGGPRATSEVATYDSLWVRLVDLPEALQDRTWSAPCDVVVEVADTSAPWNDGSWRIRADDAGEATVERTTAESDVRLGGGGAGRCVPRRRQSRCQAARRTRRPSAGRARSPSCGGPCAPTSPPPPRSCSEKASPGDARTGQRPGSASTRSCTRSYVARSAAAMSPSGGSSRGRYGEPSKVPTKPPASVSSSEPGAWSQGLARR